MKDFQTKLEASKPDQNLLLQENQMLKSKLEEYVLNTNNIKENLENQMVLKDKQQKLLEEEIRNTVNTKIGEMSDQTQKLLLENRDLKGKNNFYAKKFDEVNKSIQQSNEVFTKLKDEVEKRNGRIAIMEKEAFDLKNKERQSQSALLNYHVENDQLKKDYEISKKQLNSLTILCKTLQDKIKNSVPNVVDNSNQKDKNNIASNENK